MKQIGLILLLGALFLCSCQDEPLEGTDQANQDANKKEILWMIKTPDGSVPTKAVGVKGKYWGIGDTIRIKFLNGTADLQQKVELYAAIWLEYANLHFEYVGANDNADVKIGFDMDGRWLAWSTIGTDCRSVPQNQPSLNFVWLADEDDEGTKAEVLKGFGHVLGLGFEHKNPNSTLRFKPTADFEGEYNLTGLDVDALKDLYLADQTNYTAYDRSSVMVLTIPRGLVTAPNMATIRNSNLSDMDKEFIAGIYPRAVITMTYVGRTAEIMVASDWYTPPTMLDYTRKVDWGDGNIEILPKGGYYSHNYLDSVEHTLRFFGNDTLYRLFYSMRGATSIDVTKCTSLRYLYCQHGSLTQLDIFHNPDIEILSLSDNKSLTTLDLTYAKVLETFDCIGCGLLTLDVSGCPLLEWINCSDNGLQRLELNNPNLTTLYCSGNSFQFRELQNIAIALPDRIEFSEGGALEVTSTEERDQILGICTGKNWNVLVANSRAAYSRGWFARLSLPFDVVSSE